MSRKLFVNLPVSDLDRSVTFFTALGFTFDPNFTDENATCMVVNDDTSVMLLVQPFFSTFTTKAIADTGSHAEAIMAIGADSREEVDDLVDRALAAGGTPFNDKDDQGFMYGGSFQDPDGHLWEVIYMDQSQMPT